MSKFLATLLALLIVLGLDFALLSLITYLICFCFGIAFTWKLVLGIWLIIITIKLCFTKTKQ